MTFNIYIYIYIKIPYSYQPCSLSLLFFFLFLILKFKIFYMLRYVESTFFFHSIHMTFFLIPILMG